MTSATDLTDAVMKLPLRQKTKLLKLLSRELVGREKSGQLMLKDARNGSLMLTFVPRGGMITREEARKAIPDFDQRLAMIDDDSKWETVFTGEYDDELVGSAYRAK